jgi:hypothetical protein
VGLRRCLLPAIQQGYRTTLDRATTLFREAKGGLKEEAKLLRPIYMLHEVITLLLNGNREEALVAAKGIEAEYKAQKPLYDKLDERYKGISIADDDNVYHNRAFSAWTHATTFITTPIGEGFIFLLGQGNLIDKKAQGAFVGIHNYTFDAAYKPSTAAVYSRVHKYYGSHEYSLCKTATTLQNLPADHTIFKLLPPKK